MGNNKSTDQIKKSDKFVVADNFGNIQKVIFPHELKSGIEGSSFTGGISSAGNILTAGHVTASLGLSGSLTRLTDGKSYLVAGNNITITSASNGQVTITAAAEGDITSVVAGSGLSGGGLTGDVTLNVGAGTGITVNANDIEIDSDGATLTTTNSDVDHVLINDGGVFKRIAPGNINISSLNNDSGFTANVGDITQVIAGTGLSGGGVVGAVSIALDFSELTDMTGDIAGTTEFILQDSTTESRKAASEIKLSNFNNDLVAGSNTQIQFNDSSDFGGSSAFTFSGTEVELNAASPAINIRRTNNNQNSDITFKGAGGVVGASLRFSGSASNDLVLSTFTNSTLKERVRVGSNADDITVEVTGSLITSLGLSGSLTRLHDGRSYLAEGNNITISSASNGQVKIESTDTMGAGFVLEDGDGTEVTITENKEVKFVEGTGIEINWTDTSTGSDDDPYDLSFSVDVSDFMTNGSDNRVVTATGTDGMNAEANLTFNGSTLDVNGVVEISNDLRIADKMEHLNDTDTCLRFPSINKISAEAGGVSMFLVDGNSSQKAVIINEAGQDIDTRFEAISTAGNGTPTHGNVDADHSFFLRGDTGQIGLGVGNMASGYDDTRLAIKGVTTIKDPYSSDTWAQLTGSSDDGRLDLYANNAITARINANGMSMLGGDASNPPGMLIVRRDGSTTTNEFLGGIGFDSSDGNVPSTILHASAYIAGYAAETHTTSDKGGYLVLGTSAVNDNDDTTSNEVMRIGSDGLVTLQNNIKVGGTSETAESEFFGRGTTFNDPVVRIRQTNTADGTTKVALVVELDQATTTTYDSTERFISFYQNTTRLGSINGSGPTYGTFTGSHIGTTDSEHVQNWEIGMILKSTGKVFTPEGGMSLAWVYVDVTYTSNDKAVCGVLSSINDLNGDPIYGFDDFPDTQKVIDYNALGEGRILVTNTNGNIEVGDFICSSSSMGLGEKQSDDIFRNYTVAKANEAVDWSGVTAENGIKKKLIACTYHCG